MSNTMLSFRYNVYLQLLGLAYLATFIWLLIFVTLSIPVFLWVMVHIVCREETDYWRSISTNKDERDFTYTFNLTHYGTFLFVALI